jgi:hypothetical protein
MFFFEKKNQKTFATLAAALPAPPRLNRQKSFASFLQKRRPSFPFVMLREKP